MSAKRSSTVSRREFLRSATAAAIASGVAPAFLGAQDKADSKPAVIGVDGYRYECNHSWGELPSHIKWETTHGVAVDEAGLVYVKQQGHGKNPMDTVVVFDPHGKFVRSFGKEIYPGGHGIDIRKENGVEYLYLCDVNHHEVLKTSLKGEVVWKMSFPAEPGLYKDKGAFTPTNVAFAPDGGLYVGDGYGSNYIHQYDAHQKWIRSWGGAGSEKGRMSTPHGIWLDNRPGRDVSLIVADRANARLQYFTLDGKHLSFINDVLFPAHFDIRGDVLLVPDLHARVSLFDKNNKVIVHLGDDKAWIEEVKKFKVRMEPEKCPAGKFVHPHDACFDKDGNIFVAEWVHTGRLSFLKKVG